MIALKVSGQSLEPKSRESWNLESGIWNLESEIRNPESGIRNPEFGIRNSESTNQTKQVLQMRKNYVAKLLPVKIELRGQE